jgi:dUTP pyrophosphatase
MEGQERFYERGVLSGSQIRQLIEIDPPLITGYRDLDAQIQPNGFDLTLAEIKQFNGSGRLTIDNSERVLPELLPTPEIDGETVYLEPGAFHILYNETVALPHDLMALGRPRSTLNRCGATIHTAVWDAGYQGRSTSLLVVNNPHGIFIQIGARIAQLVFLTLAEMTEAGYQGIYQGENRL